MTLTDSEIVAAIIKHGIAIRQIPLEVISIYAMRHHKEGNEIIQYHGREMSQEKKTPNHAGYWMCQKSYNTSSSMDWNGKPNLAPTLAESIALYIRK